MPLYQVFRCASLTSRNRRKVTMASVFQPIAIIGRACLLPKASSPEALWQNTLYQKDCLQTVSEQDWKLSLGALHKLEDKTASLRGGYIEENIFTPEHPEHDTLTQWLIHVGKSALCDAELWNTASEFSQAGAVMGNLSYPTLELSEYAQSIWLQQPSAFPQHRFMSGMPVITMAKSLGLGLADSAYAIDAACASSLYAIKLACDELHENRAKIMLAGGINAADDLYLHMGFTALSALSPTGQSRPFQSDADGLVPAQGAAVVVLKLLEDAIRDNNKILGVIRGIGLSNDGAQKGFLAPSVSGQVMAMQKAYQSAQLEPDQISWIDCHATGTKVGDACEMQSLESLFGSCKNKISLGTLKANIGHTITASGAAALINVLSGFEHQIKPPARGAGELSDPPFPFEFLTSPTRWTTKQHHPRTAAINSFGFGGNNAHLIVQEYHPGAHKTTKKTSAKSSGAKIAVTGIQLHVGNITTVEQFKQVVNNNSVPEHYQHKITKITLPVKTLKFPPNDLQNALGQQLILLKLMHDLNLKYPDEFLHPEKIGVYINMQTQPDIARYSLKWRLGESAAGIMPKLTASHVLGCMPNIVSNRLNNQYNFQGPSFSVSAEHSSGLKTLEIAIDALNQGEIDLAIVGAVDLCCEPVQTQAVKSLLAEDKHVPCDAAVILLLKHEKDVIHKDSILTEFNSKESQEILNKKTKIKNLHQLLGYSGAADDLLKIAAGLLVSPEYKKIRKIKKIKSKIAFVFTGSQTSYPNMGKGLIEKFLSDAEYQQHKDKIDIIYKFKDLQELSILDELHLSCFLSHLHAKISRDVLGLHPDVCIGHCAGETNALFAMDIWSDQEKLFQDLMRSGLYQNTLSGKFDILSSHSKYPQWQSVRVLAPVLLIKTLLTPSVYITLINTENDCVLSGEKTQCEYLIKTLLKHFPHAGIKPLPYSMVIHCPEFFTVRDTWKQIHTRPIYSDKAITQQVKFYSTGTEHAVKLNPESIAEALTQQAANQVDFPRVVNKAWNDGVRIFIEHGPRNLCTQWINEILKDKPHIALSLDCKTIDPLIQLERVKQQLDELEIAEITEIAGT